MLLARESLLPKQPEEGGHKDVLCSSSTLSLTYSSPIAGRVPSSYCNIPALHSRLAPIPPSHHSTLLTSEGCHWELEQESSAELLALLIPECFSRNHSPATFLKNTCRHVAFKARMGAVKFLYLYKSGSGSPRVINECWQEMGDDLNMLSLCHIQFLSFPSPHKMKSILLSIAHPVSCRDMLQAQLIVFPTALFHLLL